MIKRITIRTLDRWGACDREPGERYDDARLIRLGFGDKGITPLELANKRPVPVEDRLWALLRVSVLGRKAYYELGYQFADRAVREHAIECGIPAVEKWAREWLSGEDRSKGAAARAAVAARAATWAATWAASAAAVAGEAAATWAVWAASAEQKWHLAQIRKVLQAK